MSLGGGARVSGNDNVSRTGKAQTAPNLSTTVPSPMSASKKRNHMVNGRYFCGPAVGWWCPLHRTWRRRTVKKWKNP